MKRMSIIVASASLLSGPALFAKETYQLDDRQTAGKFEGKRVSVTGTPDAEDNTIHVQRIEDAAA
jgi:hypothetical protein